MLPDRNDGLQGGPFRSGCIGTKGQRTVCLMRRDGFCKDACGGPLVIRRLCRWAQCGVCTVSRPEFRGPPATDAAARPLSGGADRRGDLCVRNPED